MSAKWLDNLNVSKKLGLGFAAILLGVLTVTAIGYSSTNLLIERLGKSGKVAEIKADVLNARIAAQAYATGPSA
ncbi:methyl-accepting chemotaxis protein, partial [Pseudomonas syringae pv. actinidiae ICMP 19096]